MSEVKVKPWQRIPVWATCETCGEQAFYRVTGGGFDFMGVDDDGTVKVALGESPSPLAALACVDHYQPLLDRVCDAEGAATGDTLRLSWKFWAFHCTKLGRPIGNWQVARHNRRFDRLARRI